jgi:N-acetylmuramoyl-L-alanine amidase
MIKPQSPHAAKVFPSANHGDRIGKSHPDMLILHYTGMADAAQALQWLCNPVSQVSSHYFVFENGHILQLVPEERRAWHAGLSSWHGEQDINSCSIGIEIANPGHVGGMPAYREEQIAALTLLCRDLVTRWTIPPERVLAHSDIAPLRKEDPGENFPWARLNAAGIGHYVRTAPIRDGRFFAQGEEGPPIEALQSMFALYGYDVPVSGVFCAQTRAVVSAFQRHFRQERVDGIADASTITTLRDLLAGLSGPVA